MKKTGGMFENGAQVTADSVLILHILKLMGEPVTDSALTEILMGPGLVNYFTSLQCLSVLTEEGLVRRSLDSMGKAMYDITVSGEDMLASLKYMLSGGLGAAYESYIANHRDDIKKRTRIDASWTQDAKGNYFVHCYVREGIRAVIDLTLPVSGRADAETVIDRWKNDTSEMYIDILKAILNRG